MPDYWAVEGSGIWLLEGGNGGWLLEISEPATECLLVDLATLKTRLGITDASMDDYLTAQIQYISAVR